MISLVKKYPIGNTRLIYILMLCLVCLISCVDLSERQEDGGASGNSTETTPQGGVESSGQPGVPAQADVSTTDVSVNPTDFEGTYEGTVPCKDCDGIQTTIVINKNQTYRISSNYLGRNKTIDDNGRFKLIENASVVHLQGKNTDLKLKIGENKLFQLDEDGETVQGENAEQYVYYKKLL